MGEDHEVMHSLSECSGYATLIVQQNYTGNYACLARVDGLVSSLCSRVRLYICSSLHHRGPGTLYLWRSQYCCSVYFQSPQFQSIYARKLTEIIMTEVKLEALQQCDCWQLTEANYLQLSRLQIICCMNDIEPTV